MPHHAPRPLAFLLLVLGLAAPAPAQSEPAGAIAPAVPSVRLAPAFPQLSFLRPVLVTNAGDGSNRLFVIEQPGRVRVFVNAPETSASAVFLDIRKRVRMQHNEEGLLGLAFHPRYRTNGRMFVAYTASEPRRLVLSSFTVADDDPDRADPATETVLLEIEQPYGNHNGATVAFGPDGFLYVSVGDGGWANDPQGHGQNLGTLLGAILRIDVDRADDGRAYAIPADNPFVGQEGARGEIWAYGLRNVWRMSFDRATGELWAGDVGQNRYEEVDRIVRGGNYGWNLREGKHPFRTGEVRGLLLDPIVEYGRDQGISITGGHVYRGARFPALRGTYFYADYVTGRIWGLRADGDALLAHGVALEPERRQHVSSFGEDEAGEVYVTTFDKLDQKRSRGRVWRIVANE